MNQGDRPNNILVQDLLTQIIQDTLDNNLQHQHHLLIMF